MNLEEKIERLGRLLEELNISEIFIKEGDDYIRMVKEGPMVSKKEDLLSKEYKEILAPLSGRFYRAQNPQDPPFVEIGDIIEKDTTICLIEAMKIFNEIKAQIKGKVINILPQNGHLVKEGDILFLIDPIPD